MATSFSLLPRGRSRWPAWLAALATCALAAPRPGMGAAAASAEGAVVEYSIKGAYLYNFTRFVEWPARAATVDEPFVVALVGCPGVAADAISTTLRGKRTADGRAIEVRIYAAPTDDISRAQLIFVGEESSDRVAAIQAAVASRPVLIVGDEEGSASRGCTINFAVAGDAVRIEVNLQRAERAGLKLSGRLANVARLVRDEQPD